MTTTSETVRKLLLAHFESDSEAFRTAARDYIAEERRKNHHLVARDLDRLLASYNGLSLLPQQNALVPVSTSVRDLPCDKDRNLPLVEVIEPRRHLDDLVLDDNTRTALNRIVQENRAAHLLKSYGTRPANRILLCGPPGCGKTVSAEAIANELYLPLTLVRFDAVVSSYLGETAANLRKVFDYARSRPMVILFDEFDAIGKDRASAEEHGEIKRVVNSFLQILDSFRSDTITIAATNHEGLLDTAIWRRFDEVIPFPRPTQPAIQQLLEMNLRQIGIQPRVNLRDIARKLVGLTHADVEHVAQDAIKTTLLSEPGPVTHKTLEDSCHRQIQRNAIARNASPARAPREKTATRRQRPATKSRVL